MSDTPRTDALIPPPPKRQTATYWRNAFFLMTGHAKQLERENLSLFGALENLLSEYEGVYDKRGVATGRPYQSEEAKAAEAEARVALDKVQRVTR